MASTPAESALPPVRWPRSTTLRIAVIMFLGFATSSAIILGFIARVTQGQLLAETRALLTVQRDAVAATFNRGGPAAAGALISSELLIAGPLAMRLDDRAGNPIAGNVRVWPQGIAFGNRIQPTELTRRPQTTPEAFAVTATRLPDGHRLLVGRSLAEDRRLTTTLTTSLIAAIGLALGLSAGLSVLATRISERRIEGMARVAGAVAAGDLSRRVDVAPAGSGDAFDSLGYALNLMLARIEVLVDELRAITDGLAHDLRSPLTRIKARIDRMQPGAGAIGSEITAIASEADALLAMLESSLEISRAEAGIGRDNFDTTDLATLVTDMAEMYAPLAEENGVRLMAFAAQPVPIRAHRQLLARALANLIDNALRHGPSGGIITVSATATPAGARLTVADRGPGIPPHSHGEALRRFGRLDAARSTLGAGLGLSLAAAIARLHGGTLGLSSNSPGLKVTLDLPGVSEPGDQAATITP